MKRLVLVLIMAAAIFSPTQVGASTRTTDITDMWWNPAESGWGVNITLQNDIAFLTFFVYDTSRIPFWVTATAYYQGITAGSLVWSGALYESSGPWFGGPFNPATVLVRQAGTATFTLQTINRATLTYTVDGVVVTKSVQRQTWRNEDYSGNYGGGYSLRATGCVPSSLDGVNENVGTIIVSQSGTSFTASITGNPSCSFVGIYGQTGKLGEVVGTYTCNSGEFGTFDLFEVTPTISGFNGRMQGRNNFGCQWAGFFGGITRVP